MLNLVGLGIRKEDAASVIDILKEADEVFLEAYTSLPIYDFSFIEDKIGKKFKPAYRDFVESDKLIELAKSKDVVLAVVGDPLCATTHISLIIECKKNGIPFRVIHNNSIINVVSDTGLEIYKFGRTISIPFYTESYKPEVFYEYIKKNLEAGLHSLLLLDLKPEENKFMSIKEALEILLDIEERRKEGVISKESKVVACSRLGTKERKILYASVKDLLEYNFSRWKPPFCLIIPSSLSIVEEEALSLLSEKI